MNQNGSIYQAMNEVMQAVGYVLKQSKRGLNYTYAGEAALIEAIRPHLVKHSIVVHPVEVQELHQDSYTTSKGSVMNRTAVVMIYRFAHAPSGSWIDVPVVGEGADIGDKSASKALTGAYKYALRQALLIETGDDPDKDPSSGPATNGQRKQPEPPKYGGSSRHTTELERAKEEAKKRENAAAENDDVDHRAAALEARDLADFAEHAWQALDGYDGAEHIVGALVNKWPEAHEQTIFRFTASKTDAYLQWLADRKAEAAGG